MATITIAEILDAITALLLNASEVDYAQSYDELTEGIIDDKLLQVYWEATIQDPESEGTAQTSFQGEIRQTELTIHADYFATTRKHIGEDMAVLIAGIDEIQARLETQKKKPYFGLAGIKAYKWSAQRVVFEYGDPAVRYTGARHIITIRVF